MSYIPVLAITFNTTIEAGGIAFDRCSFDTTFDRGSCDFVSRLAVGGRRRRMCGMSQNLTINRTALSTALKLPGTVPSLRKW